MANPTSAWTRPLRGQLISLLVLAASCLASVLVYRNLILPGGPLGWDESAHAVYALLIAHDLGNFDWVNLLYDTYRQVYWHPLYSWLAGIVLLFTEPTEVAVRAVSAACLVPTAFCLFLAGRRLNPQHPNTAGLFAAGLALASPALLVYSSVAMLEMLGLAAVAATLLAYVHLTAVRAGDRWHVLVGLGVLAAYFAKSNYGILLGMTLVAAEVASSRRGFLNLLSRRYFWTALPLAIAFAGWFAYPPKLLDTWETLVNQRWGPTDTYGAGGLLFYPRAWVRLSGSTWLAAAYLACIAAAVRRWKDPGIRLLVVLVGLQFLIGELHQTKLVRHLAPALPAAFLLCGYMAANLIWSGTRFRWAARGLVLTLAIHAGTLPWRVQPLVYPAGGRALVRELANVLRPPGNALAVISWDYHCPPCLDWPLVTREHVIDVTLAAYPSEVERTDRLLRAASRWPALRTLLAPLDRYASRGTARTYYQGENAPSRMLKRLVADVNLRRVAVVQFDTEPPPSLHRLILAAGFTPVGRRTFPQDAEGGNRPPVHLDAYSK